MFQLRKTASERNQQIINLIILVSGHLPITLSIQFQKYTIVNKKVTSKLGLKKFKFMYLTVSNIILTFNSEQFSYANRLSNTGYNFQNLHEQFC